MSILVDDADNEASIYLKRAAPRDNLWQTLLSHSAKLTGISRRHDETNSINSGSVVGKIVLTTPIIKQLQQLIALSGLTAYIFARVLKGQINGAFDDRTVKVETGSLLVIDCARLAKAEIEADCELQYLLIPKIDLSYPMLPRMHGFVLHPDEESEIVFLLLEKLAQDFPTISRTRMRDLKYAFTGAFMSQFDYRLGELERICLTMHDTICEYIQKNCTDSRLTVDSIISQFNISRSHLYRMFSGQGGVKAYILDRRLSNIYDDVLNHHVVSKSLKQMAGLYGFDNPQTMKNMFIKKYGFDPRLGVPEQPRTFETRI